MGDNIVHANMLLYPLYCNIISLTSLKITQVFHLLFGFAENQIIFWDFKIQNGVRITKGLDNGDSDNRDSDNRGSTVPTLNKVHAIHTSISNVLHLKSVIHKYHGSENCNH